MALAVPKKPKAKAKMGRPKVEKPRRHIFAMRGTEAFEDWFRGLADHCRMPASTVIELALIRFAEAEGYKEPAPKR